MSIRLLLLLLLCLLTASTNASPLPVYGSVAPISAIVAAVGGEQVKVASLLRPGESPLTFSPTPRQLADLADSRLLFSAGLPFERAWIPRIRGLSPTLEVVDLRQGLDLIANPHAHPGADHHGDADEPDPHIWTDPLLVVRISEVIRDRLSQLDPGHAPHYSDRQQALARRLLALDRKLSADLASLAHRRFLVFHPAWGYFARRYGLTQLAIEHEGKQAGGRWVAELIEQARRDGIRVILVQPQFDRRLAQQIADAIGGRVFSVDPLSRDFEESLRKLAAVLREESR